jgi:hypothetical protein
MVECNYLKLNSPLSMIVAFWHAFCIRYVGAIVLVFGLKGFLFPEEAKFILRIGTNAK